AAAAAGHPITPRPGLRALLDSYRDGGVNVLADGVRGCLGVVPLERREDRFVLADYLCATRALVDDARTHQPQHAAQRSDDARGAFQASHARHAQMEVFIERDELSHVVAGELLP